MWRFSSYMKSPFPYHFEANGPLSRPSERLVETCPAGDLDGASTPVDPRWTAQYSPTTVPPAAGAASIRRPPPASGSRLRFRRALKAVARQAGFGHEQLARLLRERGVVLRNHSSSSSKIRLMRSLYEQRASRNAWATSSVVRREQSANSESSPIPRHVTPCQFQPHGLGESVVVIS